MPSLNPKKVVQACRLSFHGVSDLNIAQKLQVHPITISRWRNNDLWQQTLSELIKTTLQQEQEKDNTDTNVN